MVHKFSVRLQKASDKALKEFGTYNFYDSPPYENLDYDKLLVAFKKLKYSDMLIVVKDLKGNKAANFVLGKMIGDISGQLSEENIHEISKANPKLDW